MKEKFFPSPSQKGRSRGEPSKTLAGLKVGERVRIETLRSDGTVIKVEEPLHRVEVMTEKGKVRASFSDVMKVEDEDEVRRNEPPKAGGFWKKEAQEPPSQLNVIGLTVDDALPMIDKFIDQAFLHGLEKVQIIHGVGSGRLRNAIGKYLNGHRAVKRVVPGNGEKGGRGLTLVELI